MFDLSNKIALVTGASGGIGRSIVEKLHTQGAHVILSYFSDESVFEMKDKLGERVTILKSADVGTSQGANSLISEAEECVGNIDILVNNAGITRDGLSIRMSEEDWNKVINVNLTSSFLLSKLALLKMMKKKWGRIINIASVVGLAGNAGQANYSAAKGGMIAMGKTLAKEFANRGITVNSVAPGYIKTKMTDNLGGDFIKTIPMNRMGLPEEIASAVVFLSSDEAGYITGQTLSVNGGLCMQ